MAIIVSGCPRSGTSLTMDIMRSVFGDERILGYKFPQCDGAQTVDRLEGESFEKYSIRKYLQERSRNSGLKNYKDMNPNGFWECKYSVAGISYNYDDREELSRIEKEDIDNATILKIVSQGLLGTDPRYIHKVVYLIRNPRSVAKSQERLKRGFDIKFSDGKARNIFSDLVVHSPEMYISVTIQACMWILDNPEIPIHFLEFESLIENPSDEIIRLQNFLGIGDFGKASGVVGSVDRLVDEKLNRSKPEDIHSDLWEDAEFVYEKFKDKKFQEIIDYFMNPKVEFNKVKNYWPCPRYGQKVNHSTCKLCRSNKVVRENFKKFAVISGIDWKNEPCLHECGYDVDADSYVTIEESIEDNSWEK